MVCGARLGSSSRRSSHGRGLLAALASASSSVPPPVAAAAGPSSVPPHVAAGLGEFTPPHPRVPSAVPEDTVSLQEGGGSFCSNLDFRKKK
ncbi:hypothetical protein Taro_041828 [Colocasia esculenta]|uniref:Uncharacterized protein n=1 Tax=Colocasia esculenta TaxID=4460 RepID=A0A843X1A8_COLES|nr:hypothetical protein [Colocasia esculenta]